MSSLPPGVTDEMCEGGPEQFCARCGHSENDHLEENGKDPCDYVKITSVKYNTKFECGCEGYLEGEYEPDEDIGRDR